MLNAILHIIKNFHLKTKSADEKCLFTLVKSFIMYRANINVNILPYYHVSVLAWWEVKGYFCLVSLLQVLFCLITN